MSKSKTAVSMLLTLLMTLTSCSTGNFDKKSEGITQNKDALNPEGENNDETLKIEGLSYNLKTRLDSFNDGGIFVTECPIYVDGLEFIRSKNFRVYSVKDESADGAYIVPEKIAFCDIDFESEKYVLILASYLNGDSINNAVKNAFNDELEAFLYLGLPTGLLLKQKLNLENLKIYEGSVSTDDCLPDSDEFSDSECPTGNASYFRVDNFLLILSQRVSNGYKANNLSKYTTRNVLELLY